MSSWRVEFKSPGHSSVFVRLIDRLGPLNEFVFEDSNSFVPRRGDFTNQTNRVVPTIQPSWHLNDFDIDGVSVGSQGGGDVDDSGGTFPNGRVDWEVVEAL